MGEKANIRAASERAAVISDRVSDSSSLPASMFLNNHFSPTIKANLTSSVPA
jgi:hypothetical protein